MDTEATSATNRHGHDSFFLGLIVCWLLNFVQLGIAYLLFVYGERTLPTVFVLVGAIGGLQIGYVAPIWFLLRRRSRKRMARGFLIAAVLTALINAGFLFAIYAGSEEPAPRTAVPGFHLPN